MSDRAGTTSAGKLNVVVLPVALVSVTVILVALSQQTLAPRMPFPATVRGSEQRATSRPPKYPHQVLHAATRIRIPAGPRSSREARGKGRDPLRDHRAIVGYDARTPWYIRVRSAIILVLIVISIGTAFAGITMLIIASGRFLLEILAG